MDYPAMQDQPPSRSSGPRRKPGLLGGFAGLDPRRRAILLGGAIAVIGLAILLRPHPHPAGPVAGGDPGTLATLITLPAMPSGAQWRLTPLSPDADLRDLSKGRWKLEADLTFAPADASKITGPEAFFKPPFKTGTLQRLDASHLRLTLTSS
jgi:hypothetical protein